MDIEAANKDKLESVFPECFTEGRLDIDKLEKDLQIERKDRQIESLHVQISELTKAFREAQALHAGTLQRELSDNTTANNKHRWWKFWQVGK